MASDVTRTVSDLVDAQRDGFTLQQPFYVDADIFALDKRQIILREWLYAGQCSQLINTGDFVVYAIVGEEAIVVRGDDGEIHAMVNVCRHRGSRVCVGSRGNTKRFTCPYHGWSYSLDGNLVSARRMHEGFDVSQYGLRRLHVEIFAGLIFINFADSPAPFQPLREALAPRFRVFGLGQTRVGAQRSYRVEANWKLVLENYLECYHCVTAHPEFSLSHSNKLPRGSRPELEKRLHERAAQAGISCDQVSHAFPVDVPDSVGFGYDRFALLPGYQTGSESGAPLAPLLGDVTRFDDGASNGQFGALCYLLVYCDHCIIYRFTPRSVDSTDMDLFWLVNASAEREVDYHVEDLTWLWHVTTEADRTIIERNQAGVNSIFYRPGPYAPMETWARRFRDWYLVRLAG